MIKQYLNFTYNGVSSSDMGVTHVSVNSGLFQDSLGSNRTIVEQQNNLTDRRYFKRVSLDPIEIEMNIMFNQPMSDTQYDSIFSWLLQDYYKELYFESDVDKIFYCMPNGKPIINHNGGGEGYITITMRCFDGYLYSRQFSYFFDLSFNTSTGTTITLTNNGQTDIYPSLTILVKEASITILNLTTNESTQLTGLSVGETITLDNENEEISTDVAGVYRFSNLNDTYVRVLSPSNQYKVTGKCALTFNYRYKRKF